MVLWQRALPARTSEAGVALQRYLKYRKGSRAFVLTQLTVLGCRLLLGRGLNTRPGKLSEVISWRETQLSGDPGNECLSHKGGI